MLRSNCEHVNNHAGLTVWPVQHFCQLWDYLVSLVPRPFPPPVFDRLKYAKTEGEGLGEGVMYMRSGRHEGRVVPDHYNSQTL